MSKWNKYAVRVQSLALQLIEARQNAREALERAEALRMSKFQQHLPLAGGGLSPERYAFDNMGGYEQLMANPDATQEQKDMARATREMILASDQMHNVIRAELQEELTAFYAPKAADIDGGKVQLINTGILTADEIGAMLEEETAAGNNTMRRIIGKHAAERAEQLDGTPQGAAEANAFRLIAQQAAETVTDKVLDAFDRLVLIYDSCIGNEEFAKSFKELTEEEVKNF